MLEKDAVLKRSAAEFPRKRTSLLLLCNTCYTRLIRRLQAANLALRAPTRILIASKSSEKNDRSKSGMARWRVDQNITFRVNQWRDRLSKCICAKRYTYYIWSEQLDCISTTIDSKCAWKLLAFGSLIWNLSASLTFSGHSVQSGPIKSKLQDCHRLTAEVVDLFPFFHRYSLP